MIHSLLLLVAFLCTPQEIPPPFSLQDGLVGAWGMNEECGVRKDAAGGFDLVPDGNPPPAFDPNGVVGGCVAFDNAFTQCLAHPDDPALRSGGNTRDFTWAAWVRVDSDETMTFVSKWDPGQKEFALQYDSKVGNKGFKFWWSPNGSQDEYILAANTTVEIGVWYLVFAWLEADHSPPRYHIQINDGEDRFEGWSFGIFEGTAPLRVGMLNAAGSQPMNGRVDAVHFWHRCLTPGERALIYNNRLGLEVPSQPSPTLESRVADLEARVAAAEARLDALEGK